MKRYLLFAGNNYYPSGGMNDLAGDFDTIEEAVAFIGPRPGKVEDYEYTISFDWAEIVELPDFTCVATYSKPYEIVTHMYTGDPIPDTPANQRWWKKMEKENETRGWFYTDGTRIENGKESNPSREG